MKQEIIAMRKAGATYQQIAGKVGVSRQRVHQIVKVYENKKIDFMNRIIKRAVELRENPIIKKTVI